MSSPLQGLPEPISLVHCRMAPKLPTIWSVDPTEHSLPTHDTLGHAGSLCLSQETSLLWQHAVAGHQGSMSVELSERLSAQRKTLFALNNIMARYPGVALDQAQAAAGAVGRPQKRSAKQRRHSTWCEPIGTPGERRRSAPRTSIQPHHTDRSMRGRSQPLIGVLVPAVPAHPGPPTGALVNLIATSPASALGSSSTVVTQPLPSSSAVAGNHTDALAQALATAWSDGAPPSPKAQPPQPQAAQAALQLPRTRSVRFTPECSEGGGSHSPLRANSREVSTLSGEDANGVNGHESNGPRVIVPALSRSRQDMAAPPLGTVSQHSDSDAGQVVVKSCRSFSSLGRPSLLGPRHASCEGGADADAAGSTALPVPIGSAAERRLSWVPQLLASRAILSPAQAVAATLGLDNGQDPAGAANMNRAAGAQEVIAHTQADSVTARGHGQAPPARSSFLPRLRGLRQSATGAQPCPVSAGAVSTGWWMEDEDLSGEQGTDELATFQGIKL